MERDDAQSSIGIIEKIKRLKPTPFVAEDIEIATISRLSKADLLVISPKGIFLGAREENLANAQQALSGLIREAWREDDRPTLRSALLAGDSTRLLHIIESAKDEVSKDGAIRLLDFLGIYRSSLSGTWLGEERPVDVKRDPVDRFALHEGQGEFFTEEFDEAQARRPLEDSFASRSKAQNIVVTAVIAGTLVIAGVVLWIVYPHFVGSSKPEQKTPPPLFVPGKPESFSGNATSKENKAAPPPSSKAESPPSETAKRETTVAAAPEVTQESLAEKTKKPSSARSKPTAKESPPRQTAIKERPVELKARPLAPKFEPPPSRSDFKIPAKEPSEGPQIASITRPSPRPAEPGLYETVRTAEVRESPEPGGRLIDQIPPGTKLRVTGSQGDWLVVQSKTKNITAYVKREDAMRLPEKQQQQAEAGVPESKWPEIQNRIAHAMAQRGIKGVEVTFIGDTAYLKGTVKTESERERAAAAATEILEVKRVTNWITVDRSWSLFGN